MSFITGSFKEVTKTGKSKRDTQCNGKMKRTKYYPIAKRKEAKTNNYKTLHRKQMQQQEPH
jgi:hypothetical protein